MAEYIKRETLLAQLEERQAFLLNEYGYHDYYTRGFEEAVDKVQDFPSDDVAPVRHAKWEVVIGSDGKERMVCTGCRKQQDLTGVFIYCPNCGAKMDLED